MNKKSTRLSRWKAALCVAAIASGTAMIAQADTNGGYAGPTVTPSSLNFGNVAVGSTSATQNLTVNLAGGSDLTQPTGFPLVINSITLPIGFIRDGGNCVVGGGGTPNPCTVGIAFQPPSTGDYDEVVAITASSNGSPPGTTNVAVTATSGTATGIPSLNALGLALMLAGLGGLGMIQARRS